jgi:spermidine synthase
MSQIFLDSRDGGLRLYLNGELQFDSRDERLYHEPLALVPTALARARAAARVLRVLILGGGDGLALREVLRIPEVVEAHVVDHDPDVLRLGAGPLAALNAGAFRDPRTRVHVRDAREFLRRARDFDVVIFDLTYPGDVAGAALLGVPVFRKARAALRPGGVLSVNAASPEETPQAFGCVGRTLGAAGLAALAYAFTLPSFLAEGYGRWGFLFASSRTIGMHELRRLRLPADAGLTPPALLEGLRLPASAGAAMRVAPNRTTELLYYTCNPTPLAWSAPWRPLRFAAASLGVGPRLTAAQGFGRWLRAPAGRRTLAELLACVPLAQRGQTREAFLEWSEHAAILFREVDLQAFLERALRRAAGLPRAWVRELRRLRDRIRAGLPPMEELLEQAYRVCAIYLLVLLLANLFFPDNLYAKGSSSSSSRSSFSSSSGDSAPFHGFSFSDPGRRYGAYRSHSFYSRGWTGSTPGGDQVSDAEGRPYPALRFALTDPRGGRKPVASLLALGPELQLLETGAIACGPAVPGYQCLLEPGRVRAFDQAGREVLALTPPARLQVEAATRVAQQGPLIDTAVAEHRRWLEWTRWGAALAPGQVAISELATLQATRQAVETAREAWQSQRPAFDPPTSWVALFPGVYLEPARFTGQEPTLVLVGADGGPRRQPIGPPARLTDADRFVFRLLYRRYTDGKDVSLGPTVATWLQIHGSPALGVPPRS